MKCKNIQKLLPDFVQGRSSDREAGMIRDHLSQCHTCLNEAQELAQLTTDLSQLRLPAPSAAYWNSLLVNIHERLDERSARMMPEWVTRFVAPAAATLVLMLVLLSGNMLKESTVDSDLRALVSAITGDELQQLTDQTTLSSEISLSFSPEPSQESSEDLDVLFDLPVGLGI